MVNAFPCREARVGLYQLSSGAHTTISVWIWVKKMLLKVLANEKEAGWQWYHSIGLALSCSRRNFQTNWCRPHPVRGLKLLREPCFYYLQTIIVSQYCSGIASELSEKICETCIPRGEFKHRFWFFADTPNIARNGRILWKDLWWWADSYRPLKYRGGCTLIPLF